MTAAPTIERFNSSDIMWAMDGATLMPTPTGEWVRYSDHVTALAALPEAPAVPVGVLPEGTLAMHGNDITIAYSCREEAERAFDSLEAAMAANGELVKRGQTGE